MNDSNWDMMEGFANTLIQYVSRLVVGRCEPVLEITDRVIMQLRCWKLETMQ